VQAKNGMEDNNDHRSVGIISVGLLQRDQGRRAAA
jgi:hypothetical protein